MLCSKCGKRPAVVFVSVNKDDTNPKGYCLTCAKELGIKPVEDLIKKMGLSEEDLAAMEDQMNSMHRVHLVFHGCKVFLGKTHLFNKVFNGLDA